MIEPAESTKIILVELDIGQQQSVWFNYSAFTYYVDFDAVYDLIDAAFLVGVSAQDIDNVGSVSSDAAALLQAASVSQVETHENTFYFDAGTRRVYIHLISGDEPSLHRLVLGIVFGAATRAGVYGGTLYEGRLLSAPNLSKDRDPLFWGVLTFGGGSLTIDNADGYFDRVAEDQDLFGNKVRVYLGFDDEDRAAFRLLYTGTIGNVRVGTQKIEVEVADPRRYLSVRAPDLVFSAADYPNLKDGNEGKSIPIGYGTLRNIKATCINEAETPAPATFNFKFLDTTYHAIYSIDTVYVEGVAKTPTATSLTAATFSLATADYDPGQEVTVDIHGYKDGSGNLIENALDVIVDLIECWIGTEYGPAAYDEASWAIAQLSAPDVHYWADKPTELSKIIEEICNSVQGLFMVDRFGRYTFRIPNLAAYPVQTIEGWEILEEPSISYNPSEVLGVVLVGYSRDWSEDDLLYLRDSSHRAAVLERYKTAPEKTFDTLLVDSIAAQAFADRLMLTAAQVPREITLPMKVRHDVLELGDIVEADLQRRGGAQFVGTIHGEVVSLSYDLIAARQTVGLRITEIVAPSIYVEGGFYGDMFYGDDFYGQSGEVAA